MTMPDQNQTDPCDEAIAGLFLYLDNEMDDEAKGQLEIHLHQCSPCLEAFDFQAQLQKLVSEKCRERVPEALRLRIAHLLAENPPAT